MGKTLVVMGVKAQWLWGYKPSCYGGGLRSVVMGEDFAHPISSIVYRSVA